MSHTKLVKITTNMSASGQNHKVRGFRSLISKIPRLLDSQNIVHDSIGEILI